MQVIRRWGRDMWDQGKVAAPSLAGAQVIIVRCLIIT